jgi:hypothetical protein
MSNYLFRLAHFAFRRRRLVLAIWLVAAVSAITLGVAQVGARSVRVGGIDESDPDVSRLSQGGRRDGDETAPRGP